MRPHMRPNDTWSFRGGHDILERKRLLEELPATAEAYDTQAVATRTSAVAGKFSRH